MAGESNSISKHGHEKKEGDVEPHIQMSCIGQEDVYWRISQTGCTLWKQARVHSILDFLGLAGLLSCRHSNWGCGLKGHWAKI